MKRLANYILIAFLLLGISCSEDDFDVIQQPVVIAELYADSLFLNIDGDLYDHETIWGNVDTYIPAFMRMKAHLKIENGRLAWDFKSGTELKISENIYEYVTGIWSRQNKKLDSGEYRLEIVEGDYRIIAVNQEAYVPTKTGQMIFPGQHGHNHILLRSFYDIAHLCSGHYLSEYIENLGDRSIFNPNYWHGDNIGTGTAYSYNCENACYFDKKEVDCRFNIINSTDIEFKGKEIWRYVRNSMGLPVVSLMNGFDNEKIFS